MEPLKEQRWRPTRKAEASFAHSKRCREVRLLLQTLRLRYGPRGHDARSVWSARSLLPLCIIAGDDVRETLTFGLGAASSRTDAIAENDPRQSQSLLTSSPTMMADLIL